MKKAEFLGLVKAELDHIKKEATPAEIKRLNIDAFKSDHPEHCIYGQMTGYCDSSRARQIYAKTFGESYKPNMTSKATRDANGTLYAPFIIQDVTKKGTCFTALEKYLWMVKRPMHKKIIKYLKGEIDSINLK